MIYTRGTPQLAGLWWDRPAAAIPFNTVSASFQAFSGRCLYLGIAGYNTSATGEEVRVCDGLADTTRTIDGVTAPATSVFRAVGIWPGVLCESGIWVVVNPSSTLSGTVWYLPLAAELLEAHDRSLGLGHTGDRGQGNTGVPGNSAGGHATG